MKQVVTHEEQLSVANTRVSLSLSKYADCLFVFINQTGAPGSILQGKMTEMAGETVREHEQEYGQEETPPLYEMRVLFGSSQIEFYELLLRRVMAILWEQLKIKDNFRVLLNISLPVLKQSFEQQPYYSAIVESLRKSLPQTV